MESATVTNPQQDELTQSAMCQKIHGKTFFFTIKQTIIVFADQPPVKTAGDSQT
jgi:hypothetical protein